MNDDDVKMAFALLNSVEFQNKIIDSMPDVPDDMMPDFIRERLEMPELDEWPDATGEFGRTPTNPILTNRSWGQVSYLSRLIRDDGQRMVFHRAGSVAGAIDAFELISIDGKNYDVLYIDMYHRYQSKKAPEGYKLLDFADGITGTSQGISNFPHNLVMELAVAASNLFGAPIVSRVLKEFNAEEAIKTYAEKNNVTDLCASSYQ